MIREKYILGNQKFSTEIPEKRHYEGQKMTDEIIRQASRIFRVPIQSLGRSKRGEVNHARLAAVHLTRQLSCLRLSEIAAIFGMNSYKTVGTSCYRLKERVTKDKSFKRKYDRLKLACSQEET